MRLFSKLSQLTVLLLVLPALAYAAGAYAPVNGLKMYYEVHGKGGRPLVLLHGGGSTIETSFGTVLKKLAKTRKVIALEHQGHGHTGDLDRPFTFEQSADDTAALLKYLKVEKADFYGYSNGGNVAMHIALRHPELVGKLVLLSSMYQRSGRKPEFWKMMETTKEMPEELTTAYLKVAPEPKNLPVLQEKCAKRMREFKDMREEDLRGIHAPTLVIVGDQNDVSPEHAVAMFRLFPHGRLAILPADHMTIVKKADALLAILPPFLDE